MLQVVDCQSGRVLSDRVALANTRWRRMKGLLGRKVLPPGEGLWIRPCNQIHMYMMRFPVDVVFLDGDLRVVHVIASQPVNTVSEKVPTAESVLEFSAGYASASGIIPGMQVEFTGDSSDRSADVIEEAGALLANVCVASLFALFAYVHWWAISEGGQWAVALPILIQESLLVLFFLSRRRAREVSPRVSDWLLGMIGTCLPLLLRPTSQVASYSLFVQPLQVIALIGAVLGTLSLGRSIGIVAGNRGVKSGGMHGFVRHPMYASYMLAYLCYTAIYPGLRNVLITATTIVAMILRAQAEERFLSRDAAYRDYMDRVRFRFFPYLI